MNFNPKTESVPVFAYHRCYDYSQIWFYLHFMFSLVTLPTYTLYRRKSFRIYERARPIFTRIHWIFPQIFMLCLERELSKLARPLLRSMYIGKSQLCLW